MAHGNRTQEDIKHIHIEWSGSTDSHSKIAEWITKCMEEEKALHHKNKLASEEFHKQLQR